MIRYLLLILACIGCAAGAQSITGLQSTIHERTGQRVEWRKDAATDEQVGDAVHRLLRRPLTAESAVQIALLNNRELQSTFENIGIANADLIEAGLLKNPVLFASPRFPDRPPSAADAEFSVGQDFLDFVMMPLRKKVARQQLARAQLQVGDAILKLAADTRTTFFQMQAESQLLTSARSMNEACDAAQQLALRQHEAGNISDLELANRQAECSQATADVLGAEFEMNVDRHKLDRLMGLWGADLDWKITEALPPLPAKEPPDGNLESLALSRRLDLAATEAEWAALVQALGITKSYRYVGSIELGVDTENQTDNQRITGPTLQLEVPIFNHGQGRIARLQAQLRQVERTAEAQAIDIRADVRDAVARVAEQRALALQYRDQLIPQRKKIVDLTTTRYNSMLQGGYDILLAKQNELAAERGYITALRDYWIARADLDRATGGARKHTP